MAKPIWMWLMNGWFITKMLCHGLQVLQAVMHGDSLLFTEHQELMDAFVRVYFHSCSKKYNRVECWGPLKDAAQVPRAQKNIQLMDWDLSFIEDYKVSLSVEIFSGKTRRSNQRLIKCRYRRYATSQNLGESQIDFPGCCCFPSVICIE